MAQFRLEHGPIPLHHQVYLDVRRALAGGEWSAGDRLPTERELATRYGCSLITVRRALDELAREGRIERTRGRGTFVLASRIEHDFAGQLSFSEDMRRRGLRPSTRLVERHVEPATDLVAEALGIAPGSPVVYVERVRMADDEPLLLEQARLSAERFPTLLQADLERESLYDLLLHRHGTRVVRSSETIEPVRVPRREADLLAVRPGSLALLVIGTAATVAGPPVEYTRSFIRTDRTRYRLDRVIQRPGWARSFETGVRSAAASPSAPGGKKGGAPIAERVSR
ncbi:MAG TPA: GntR family transcriptional regulator [Candidatus Limnocylindria bacterium]|nr:GntR family transcriptional regulator [Candidatus Limnocylindria bacterium]